MALRHYILGTSGVSTANNAATIDIIKKCTLVSVTYTLQYLSGASLTGRMTIEAWLNVDTAQMGNTVQWPSGYLFHASVPLQVLSAQHGVSACYVIPGGLPANVGDTIRVHAQLTSTAPASGQASICVNAWE